MAASRRQSQAACCRGWGSEWRRPPPGEGSLCKDCNRKAVRARAVMVSSMQHILISNSPTPPTHHTLPTRPHALPADPACPPYLARMGANRGCGVEV